MPREVSRRTSIPPEQKGKVVRPDMPGKRDLDPKQVRDVPDPLIDPAVQVTAELHRKLARQPFMRPGDEAIQRGREQDDYLGSLNPTDGPSRVATGYVDNNDPPRRPDNAKRK